MRAVIPVELFHEGPFRWRLGTRRLDASGWLQFDLADLDGDLAEKAAILAADRADASVAEDGSEAASREVVDLVDAALASVGRPPVPIDGRHPLERAACAVHEDLVLLQRREHGWVMTAGVVCFPTRWSAAEKLGRSMAEIHDPVPRYEAIAPAVDRLFDRLRSDAVVWRPNWSIVGEPDLRLPVQHRQAPSVLPTDPGRSLWLRVERQTVRRLTHHDDHILFTIRIHRWPLAEVLAEIDHTLATELRSLPDDVARYKNLEHWRHELADRLDEWFLG